MSAAVKFYENESFEEYIARIETVGEISPLTMNESDVEKRMLEVEHRLAILTEVFSILIDDSENPGKFETKMLRLQKNISNRAYLPSKKPIIVLVTGAAGNIGYQLIFAIARGDMLGENQPIELRLLEIPPCLNALKGVQMEIEDCAFPLVTKIVSTDNYEVAFTGIDIALLVGSRPRGPGMLRKDLLKANASIFKGQGAALDKYAKKSVKVLVVGNPANTNALIASHNAPSLPKTAFTALTRLDQNRAKIQLAKKLDKPVSSIKKVAIWGNHSSTQYPDCNNVVIDHEGKRRMYSNIDARWVEEEFIPTIQQRGKAVIAARKKSSAASAANAIVEHVRDWVLGTPEGDWSSMGIMSDGKAYNIPAGLIFSYPCICKGGIINPVIGIPMSKKSKKRIETTAKELQSEKIVVIN